VIELDVGNQDEKDRSLSWGLALSIDQLIRILVGLGVVNGTTFINVCNLDERYKVRYKPATILL